MKPTSADIRNALIEHRRNGSPIPGRFPEPVRDRIEEFTRSSSSSRTTPWQRNDQETELLRELLELELIEADDQPIHSRPDPDNSASPEALNAFNGKPERGKPRLIEIDAPTRSEAPQIQRERQFVRLPLALVSLPLYLGRLQMTVLLAFVQRVNWSDRRQGDVRAAFVSDETIADEVGRDRSNVSRAFRAIQEFNIVRDATPAEEAAVLADAKPKGRGRGRRPKVRVLVDPAYWRLPMPGGEA